MFELLTLDWRDFCFDMSRLRRDWLVWGPLPPSFEMATMRWSSNLFCEFSLAAFAVLGPGTC